MNTRRITIAQYESMTDAWAKSGKVGDVAVAGGVSTDIAKKIIADGHDDYPSIRERVERLRVIHMREEDTRREEETRIARAATRKVLHDGVSAVREMKLVPKGRVVTKPDGTHEIQCDENTYKTVLGVIERTVVLRDILDGKHDRQNNTIGVGVQVNVSEERSPTHGVEPVPQMSPEETRRQAEEIMSTYMPRIDATYGRGKATTQIVSALTEAARARI